MASIIDYGSTYISANTAPGILLTGGREIATAAVYIDPANPASYNARVELKGSIGFFTDNASNHPNVNIIIFRNGAEVYNGLVEIEFNVTSLSTTAIVNVMAVDGAILGVQNYQLAVSTSETGVFVKGPIAFSATAIGL